MIAALLLTNDNLDFTKLYETIKNALPNLKDNTFNSDKENNSFIDFGKWPNDFRITLNNEKLRKDDELPENFYKKINIVNPSFQTLELHQFDIINELISIISRVIPELSIYLMDFDWVGTANEYLSTTIESIKSNKSNY